MDDRVETPRPRTSGTAARCGGTLAGLAIGGALLALVACSDDPFERPGTWQAVGANEANLRAMVQDPATLRRGVGAGTDRGQQGSTAITTLEAGKRPAVPTTELSGVGSGGAAAGGASAR